MEKENNNQEQEKLEQLKNEISELDSRKCILPQLMKHVRLPLTSKNYILKNVIEEPLLNDCITCWHLF